MNVATNEALQAIRVVHNFYEETSENVQLICEIERIERDLQMLFRYKEADTNYRFLECLSVNESTVPTLYVFLL